MMSEFIENEASAAFLCSRGGAEFARSELFSRLYEQAMDMVRESADYLELDGVIERDGLPKVLAPVYACESMRLTTRLMQISAWLLAMRALREGELSDADVAAQRYRLAGKDVCLGGPVRGAGQLPGQLIELLGTSKRLYERVMRIDASLFDRTDDQDAIQNPITEQLDRLERTFNC